MIRTSKAAVGAICALVVAMALSTATATAATGGIAIVRPGEKGFPAAVSRGPIEKPGPLQRRWFAVFRSAPEAVPPAISQALAGQDGTETVPAFLASRGVNVTLAQEANAPGSGMPVWVIPGRGHVLVCREALGEAVLGVCTYGSTTRAIREGLGLSLGHHQIFGLVRDDVTAVRLGDEVVAPVGENVFSADGKFPPGSIEWTLVDPG